MSAENMHAGLALKSLTCGMSAICPRPGPASHRPATLSVDGAYFSADRLARLRERGLIPYIARSGIGFGEQPGWYRWKSERSRA
ncbi:hypothetical protein [Streptomyces tremellae]|uniref:hypothetical protein n=1 Tax=Streptomyces tremellae TaxID=1124239 RepID=UPI0031EB32FA